MPSRPMTDDRRINIQFSALQASYWMSYVPIGGFAVVLLQSKHFTASEIGILLAIQSLSSILAQPIISDFAERHRKIPLKRIISLMMFVAACVFSVFYFIPHLFVPAILIFIVMGMTHASAPSLMNALAMQFANSGLGLNYGVTRGIGSMAFAVMGILLGRLVDMTNESVIVPFYVVMVLITVVSLFLLRNPAIPPEILDAEEAQKERGSLRSVFQRKSFVGFLFASGLLLTSHTCINSFLPNIMNHLGGTITDQGIVRGIAAALELPVMFLYVFLSRKFTDKQMLIVAAFSYFLKTFLTLLVPSVALLFAVQILQMPAFGLYTPAAVSFANSSVSDKDRIRAQAVAMVAGFGVGNVLGNLGGGFLLDAFGLQAMLLIATITGFAGFLLMFFFLHTKPSSPAFSCRGQ